MSLPIISDFLYPLQWDLKLINVEGAWLSLQSIDPNLTFGSPDVIIAVFDSGIQSEKINTGGIDAAHVDLKGRVSDGRNKMIAFYDAVLFLNDNNKPYSSHGTSVASIISGSQNGLGSVGLCPNSRLISAITQAYGSTSPGGFIPELARWVTGIKIGWNQNPPSALVSANQAFIINLSEVFTNADVNSLNAVKVAIDDISTYGRAGLGVLFVAGAGNGDENNIAIQIPVLSVSSIEKVITVGATNVTGPVTSLLEKIAGYSNFGSQLDLTAPAGTYPAMPPKSNYSPPASYMTIAASTLNGGNAPGDTDFSLVLQNNVTASFGEVKLRVNSVEGVFPGQSVMIGTPSGSNFKIDVCAIKRIDTDSNNPPNLIVVEGVKQNHVVGELIYIASLKAKLTATPASSTGPLIVDEILGFFPGQRIIIGNPNGQHQQVLIAANGINPSTNQITLDSTTPLTNLAGYTNGSLVLAAQKLETLFDRKASTVVLVNDSTGFATGQRFSIEEIGNIGSDGALNYEEQFIYDVIPTSLQSNSQLRGALRISPGGSIAYSTHVSETSVVRTRYGNWTTEFNGTSAATPVVSGVAALVLSAKPLLSWLEVRDILFNTADKIDSANYPYVSGRNDFYGHGRVNANNAVLFAKNYAYDSRDLMIRDNPSDTGATPTTQVDSPDIWVRNLPDTTYTPPGYLAPGPHQSPNKTASKTIYIRVINVGTSLPSIAGAEVKCFISYTNQPNPAFVFPNKWVENLIDSNGENTVFIGSAKLPVIPNSVNSNEFIVTINWPDETTLSLPNPNNLQAYILAHVTPFDRGVTANDVFQNNNLTYKKLVFADIKWKDGSGIFDLNTDVMVDASGSPTTTPFKLQFQNLPITSVNNIKVNATLKYNGTQPDETITFSYNGTSWSFNTPPTGGWLMLSAPVLSGSTANSIQEFTTFPGSLVLTKLDLKVTFDALARDSSNNIVIETTFQIKVQYNLPIPPAGISPAKVTSIHTFTDFDLLPGQTGTTNFGPIIGNLTTQYRPWTPFTGILSGTQLKAYAVSDGEFFIQEIPSSNVLNLIVKPDAQPDVRYGVVKYFVYRGIKKSSFLDGTGQVLLSTTPNLSDLLTRMWAVRQSLNAEAAVNEVLKRGDMGLSEIGDSNPLSDSTLIEDIFDAHVFQRLTPGWSLGEFDTSGLYGFEVIVEGPGYKPLLGEIRLLDHVISLTYQAGQPQFANSQEEDISTKLAREQILTYVDPVAYFGLFTKSDVIVHKVSGTITVNTPAQLYTEVVSKFATKGLIYVDIRNDLNYSLNFYGTYGDGSVINVAQIPFKNATTVGFTNKPYHTNGWPILILSNTDFLSNAIDDKERAVFQLPNGDNTLPALFLSGADFYSDFPAYKEKYALLANGSSYSGSFEIGLPNNAGASVVFPFLMKFAYTRRFDITNLAPVPATLSRPWKDDYIDNLLCPVEVNITANVNDPTYLNSVIWNSVEDLKYIGWSSLKGVDFTVRSGVARDSIGEVCYGFIQGVAEESGTSSSKRIRSNLNLGKGYKNNVSFFTALRNDLKLIRLTPITINVGTTSSPINKNSIQVDSINANYAIDNLATSFDDAFCFAYTNAEKMAIQNLINAYLPGSSIYYVVITPVLKNDANDYVYYQIELGLQGVVYNSSNFTHQITRSGTGIMLFSTDGRNYFTEAYAQALATILSNANQVDFENS
jgi:hypothetical protein